MKKVLAMFLVCAMALTLSAKSKSTLLFNRYQFQTKFAGAFYDGYPALTVPLVYSGDLDLSGVYAWDDDDRTLEYEVMTNEGVTNAWCIVDAVNAKFPLYMTICQPCIDCYPCTVLGQYDGLTLLKEAEQLQPNEVGSGIWARVGKITVWNLYVVDVDKKTKSVYIYKMSLLDDDVNPDSNLDSVFFTGKNTKNDLAYVQVSGTMGNFAMVGKKNDYKFKYTEADLAPAGNGTYAWINAGGSYTAYIKSVSKFEGLFCDAEMFRFYNKYANPQYSELFGYQFCGDISLTRNASLTKKAITAAFSTVVQTTTKNWEDCYIATPADWCEAYFLTNEYDAFDSYLVDTAYKKYYVQLWKTYDMSTVLGDILDWDVSDDEFKDDYSYTDK
ncbi:MAG: hypothetical protein IKS83_06540, partial [Victivallales bacterium]|nr:hypothetical protein [Victivallales bacterium]